jgi:hypothetical protein
MPDHRTQFDVIDGETMLAASPHSDKAECDLSPFGVSAGEDGPIALGRLDAFNWKWAKRFRGNGFTVAAEGKVIDCVASECYTGCTVLSSDSECRGLQAENCRDSGLRVCRDAANGRFVSCHLYGGRIVGWTEPGGFHGFTECIFADGYHGALCESWQTSYTACKWQHNFGTDLITRADGIELVSPTINAMRESYHQFVPVSPWNFPTYDRKIGVDFQSNGCAVIGGRIHLDPWVLTDLTTGKILAQPTGRPATACRINGNDCTINKTRFVNAQGIDGATGIHITAPVARTGINIDARFEGFHKPNDRVLRIEGAERCAGLDIVLRIDSRKKPIRDYVDVGRSWRGTIAVEVQDTGEVFTLPKGAAA